MKTASTPSVDLVLDKRGDPLPLKDQPAFAAKTAEIQAVEGVERRIQAELEHDRRRARAAHPVITTMRKGDPAKPKRSALEMVKQLAAGGAVPRHPPESGVQASLKELAITAEAKVALHAELREIRGGLSHEVDRRFAADDLASAVEIYRGLAIASDALQAINKRRARKIAWGYSPYSGFVMPTSGYISSSGHIPAAAFLIGDGADPHSELGKFRRWLVAEGIMK
jgi:hypothetical protein